MCVDAARLVLVVSVTGIVVWWAMHHVETYADDVDMTPTEKSAEDPTVPMPTPCCACPPTKVPTDTPVVPPAKCCPCPVVADPTKAPAPARELPPGAMVAESLDDFRGVDNSLVFPRKAAPEIENVTQIAPRHFRFELRMRGNPWTPLNPGGTKGAWYDGDRDLKWNEGVRDGKYHDKTRAEVNWQMEKSKWKVTINNNETWDIATTVKLGPDFVPSRGYCNILQPVFDQSFLSLTGIKGDDVTANLFVFTDGIGSKILTARTFTIKRGQWTSIVVRIKFGKNGRYDVSLNDDAFQGIGLDTGKMFAERGVGIKAGVYGTSTTNVLGKPMKDLVVEHKNLYVRKVA